jgi:hypothetical protein
VVFRGSTESNKKFTLSVLCAYPVALEDGTGVCPVAPGDGTGVSAANSYFFPIYIPKLPLYTKNELIPLLKPLRENQHGFFGIKLRSHLEMWGFLFPVYRPDFISN